MTQGRATAKTPRAKAGMFRDRSEDLPSVSRGNRRGTVTAHVVLIAAAVVSFVPTVYMIDISFRNATTAFSPSLIVVKGATLHNYESVLRNPDLPRFFINSTIVAASTVILTCVIALLAGFAISRLQIIGGKVLFLILGSALFIPLASVLVPVVLLLKHLGGLNTYWGLIGPYTAIGIAFATLILKGALDSFPAELEQSARLDGASWLTVLVKIIVPMIIPAIFVVMVWQFLFSWNEFYLALVIMSNINRETMPLAPLYYEGPFLAEPGNLFAILSIVSIVPMIVYLAIQRRFVRALEGGALKG
ncbi:MAG: carbohydrate ABC transporter permease [Acidimicrobiales bacterium]